MNRQQIELIFKEFDFWKTRMCFSDFKGNTLSEYNLWLKKNLKTSEKIKIWWAHNVSWRFL